MAEPQMGSLEALQTTWSLDDLARALALLERRNAMEWAARPKAGDK